MSDTLVSVTIDASQAERRLGALPEVMRGRLRAVIIRNTQTLASRVRANLSGAVLKVRTGKLLGSIKSQMLESQTGIFGRVFSEGVPYARIHEYGGQTKAHDIRPVNAKALHFFIGNQEFFRQLVHHPGSKIPPRSYMRSALDAMRPALVAEMTEAVKTGWGQTR